MAAVTKSSPAKFAKFGGIVPIEQADTPGIPMTWEEYAQAWCAVEQALKFFDYAPLVKRLRDAGSLLPLERSIAADIISGKLKRPKHRVAKSEMVRSRQRYLAWCVLAKLSEGLLRKAAISKVVEEEHASASAVSAAVQAFPDMFAGWPNK